MSWPDRQPPARSRGLTRRVHEKRGFTRPALRAAPVVHLGMQPEPLASAGAPILTSADAHLDPLIRKLESIAPVLDDEKRAIAGLPITVRDLRADQDFLC